MSNVSDDCDDKLSEIRFVLSDSQHVEQTLCRVIYVCFPAVEDSYVGRYMRRYESRNTRRGIPNDEDIALHRLQCINSIEKTLSLGARGRSQVQIQDVGAKPPRGEFE